MHEIAEFEPRVQCAVLTPIEGCRGRGCAGGEIVFSPISIVVRPVVRQSQSHRRSVRATASLLHVGILDTPATRTRPGSRRRDKTGRKMPARWPVRAAVSGGARLIRLMNADNRRKRYNSAAGRPGHDGGRSIGLCTRYPTPGPRPTRVTHVPLVSGTDIRQAFCRSVLRRAYELRLVLREDFCGECPSRFVRTGKGWECSGHKDQGITHP